MSYSAMCKTLFSTMLLVQYAHVSGEDVPGGTPEVSVENPPKPSPSLDSWKAVNAYVNEHHSTLGELLPLLLNVPEGTETSEHSRYYLQRLNCISQALEKRVEVTESDEEYGPTTYANLSRLFQEVLARGFFTEVYEKHGDKLAEYSEDKVWVPQFTMLLRNLSRHVEHADGTDLFTYLHRQIISDAKEFGATDEVLGTISSSLTGIFSSFDKISASWLRYLGSDNPSSPTNIKYLRSDATEQKRMDSWLIKRGMRGIIRSHVFNSRNYSNILGDIKESYEDDLFEEFSSLFASVHALAYSKILPCGADVPAEDKIRYMRMLFTLYAVESSICLVGNLNSLAGPKYKWTSYNFSLMFYKRVGNEKFIEGVLQAISESDDPYKTIYEKISAEIEPLNENKDGSVSFPKQNSIQEFATSLMMSIFKVEDIEKSTGDSNANLSKAQSVISKIDKEVHRTANPSLKPKPADPKLTPKPADPKLKSKVVTADPNLTPEPGDPNLTPGVVTADPKLKSKVVVPGSSTETTGTSTDDQIEKDKTLVKELDVTEEGIAKPQVRSQPIKDAKSSGSPPPQVKLLDDQNKALETVSSRLKYLFIMLAILLVLVVVLVLVYAITTGMI